MAAERKGKEGRSGRGFASMDEDKQREIARKGGRAAHRAGTAHEFSSEEAAEAGRKGGLASGRRRAQLHEERERERQRQMEAEGNREQEMQSETDISDAESDRESGFEEASSTSREEESERRPSEHGLEPEEE